MADTKTLHPSRCVHRGFQASAIATHLRTHAKLPSLTYSRPVDKVQVAKNVLAAVAGAVTIWRLFPFIKVALVQRYIWSFLGIVRSPSLHHRILSCADPFDG